MKTIYKYSLDALGKQTFLMPKDAEILTVQAQFNEPRIWVLVDTENDTEEVVIETFGTGREIPVDMGIERKYLGTYQIEEGAQIYHVFKRIN